MKKAMKRNSLHPLANFLINDSCRFFRRSSTSHGICYFHGLAPEESVSRVVDPKSPTTIKTHSFKIKKEVHPSEVLEKIESGLSLLDCGTLCLLAIYKGLCSTLGPEKFDLLFGAESANPLYLSGDVSSPLSRLLTRREISSERDVKKGDICYFSNIKEYVAKHPVGESRGYHVICSSENPHRYIGFGLGTLFNTVEIDKTQLEYELLDSYNENPIDEGYHSEKIWDYLYSHYFRGDIKKGKDLVFSFREKKMSWDEFQKEPPRIKLSGLPFEGKMGLWIYRT